MLVLAMDTSSASLGMALWRDQSLLAETTLQLGLTHSETLMPLLDDLLRRCRQSKETINGLACTIGPGSYTGIRIGISTILGLAYARKCPVFGYSTLEIMAAPYAGIPDILVCPMLDARNQRIFAGGWHKNQLLVPENNWLAADFLQAAEQQLAAHSLSSLLMIGSGQKWLENAQDRKHLLLTPGYMHSPRAAIIAERAVQDLQAQPQLMPEETWTRLQPQYLSLSQAERKRQQKQNMAENELRSAYSEGDSGL